MEASSLKGLIHSEISFVSQCKKRYEWPRRGSPWKDGTIIEVGLALVLWNQDLSDEWGQLARQKIEHMRGDKESRGRGREKGTNE